MNVVRYELREKAMGSNEWRVHGRSGNRRKAVLNIMRCTSCDSIKLPFIGHTQIMHTHYYFSKQIHTPELLI
jgi:hypothetical protein